MSRSNGASSSRERQQIVASGNDCTHLFVQLVSTADASQSEKRRWEKQRDESMGPIISEDWLTGVKGKQKRGENISQREKSCLQLRRADEEWIGEAKKVHRSIAAIFDFLQSIRRAYLSTSTSILRQPRLDSTDARDSLQAWKGVTSLTNKERDEIEFQVKLLIKKCLARIKELEKGEEVRKKTTASLSANPFSRLLGSTSTSNFIGRSHPLYAEQLTQHRSSVIQYLGKELAQASGRLGDLQEARLRSQQRHRLNLAGAAAGASTSRNPSDQDGRNGFQSRGKMVAGSVSSSNTSSSVRPSEGNQFLLDPSTTIQDDFSSSQLTPQQIQQFEQESSALIKSFSEDLSAIQAAERSLSEISELQTQLIQHLGSQAEVADHLNQEAIGHTLEVGKGNEQLQKAKDNNRQASKFLCYFLIGSGLGLLFLHWMD